MASTQIAYAGGDVVVTINAIDSTGTHVAVTGLNASRLSSHPSAVPTVTNPDTGIYVLTWSSLSPATAEGDSIVALIDGSISGTAFSTFGIPVKVLADMRGTDNASTFNASSDTVVVGTNNDKTGYSISGTKQTLDVLNDVAATDIVSNGAITTLSGAVVNVDLVDVTTTNTDMRGTDGANTVAPDNASIAAILVDTGTDIPASIAALNDLSQADVRTAVGLASANLDTQLGDIPTVSEFNARTLIASAYFDPATDTVANVTTVGSVTNPVATDTASRNASKADVSALATSADLTTVDTVVDAIKAVTDQFVFTNPGEVDANAVTGGGGDTASTIYSYFTSGTNEDVFKADVSGLATSSALNTVDTVVDAIKSVTDQMNFTISGQIDANALTGGGGDDAATIYSYFTSANREDSFKADVPVGSGAISHEITVNVGGSPQDGVEVWVSTDASGSNVVAGTLITDAFGNATFMLDAGSYYLWAQRSGVNFTNPTSFAVS